MGDDGVFFNPIGSWLVSYPGRYNLPLIFIVFLLFVAYVVVGKKKERLTLKGILGAFGLFIVAFVAVCGVTYGVLKLIKVMYPIYGSFISGDFYNTAYYFVGFIALALAVMGGIYHFPFRKLNLDNLVAGLLAVEVIAMLAVYKFAPTGVYLLVLPLLLMLCGFLVSFFLGFSIEKKYVGYVAVATLVILPVVSLYAPMIALFQLAFGMHMQVVVIAFAALFFGLLVIQMRAAFDIHPALLPVGALLVAVIAFVGGHLTSTPSPDRPMQSHVSYCLDADGRTAQWISRISRPDHWNRQFFPEEPLEPSRDVFTYFRPFTLRNPAPVAQIPAPAIEVKGEREEKGKRFLSLQVTSRRKAHWMGIFIEKYPRDKKADAVKGKGGATEKKSRILRVTVDGREMFHRDETGGRNRNDGYVIIDYIGIPEGGLNLAIESEAGEAVRVILVDRTYGIPSFPKYKPMPDDVVVHSAYSANSLNVKKTFTFAAKPPEPEEAADEAAEK